MTFHVSFIWLWGWALFIGHLYFLWDFLNHVLWPFCCWILSLWVFEIFKMSLILSTVLVMVLQRNRTRRIYRERERKRFITKIYHKDSQDGGGWEVPWPSVGRLESQESWWGKLGLVTGRLETQEELMFSLSPKEEKDWCQSGS